jgi:N-acetyl sugar amidotransferase
MPDTRPRIEFDASGICNACINSVEKRQDVDWEKRKEEFLELIEGCRGRNNQYDCIVPWSGGKDSSSIAYRLKFDFGLNPLLITFSPLIPNEIGFHNREQILKCGFDHIFVRPNQAVSRGLARRFFIERGNPKVHWDAGVNSVPIQFAVEKKIPLVFYAEHGESEYGGRLKDKEARRTRDYTEVVEHQVGDDPSNWVEENVSVSELAPYIYPSPGHIKSEGIKAFYFSYFFRWSTKENFDFIRSKIDFHTAVAGRTDGTFTNFDSLDDKIDNVYYYMQFIKFGFGRATRDASRMIQNGQLTREQGLELAQQHDSQFPSEGFDESLDYLGLDSTEFSEIVDQHRNPEIWKFDKQWQLRHPPR